MGAVGLDLNHYSSARGPVIPKCTAVQQNDPNAQCSNGPINVIEDPGTAAYKVLLLRAEKRFSHGLHPGLLHLFDRNRNQFSQRIQSRQLAPKHRSDRFQ